MGKFRKRPVTIEAITFDEFVEHGRRANPDNARLHGGFAWHFDYAGHPITHENDDCYLIPTLEGTMRFNRGEMLITGVAGEIYPCKADIFAATYEPVDEDIDSWPSGQTTRLIQIHEPDLTEARDLITEAVEHGTGPGELQRIKAILDTAAADAAVPAEAEPA